MRPHSNPALLTVTDAAEVLGVSRQMVHKLITRGRLPKVVHYRHIYVPVAAVRQRLAELRGESGKEMTASEVARAHGTTLRAVYRWHASGQLTGRHSASRRLLFDPAEVAAFRSSPPTQERNTHGGDHRQDSG